MSSSSKNKGNTRAWSANRPTTARDMSKRQIEEYREAFKMFDKNRDDRISPDELKDVMKSLGLDPTDQEIKDMIANADVDGNNCIQFNEFLNLMIKKVPDDDGRSDELRQAFRVFDKNNDSYISRSELKSAMKKIDERMTDRDIDKIIKEADLDKDGRINYYEFVEVLMKD